MKFSDILAALGNKPKTLSQAQENLEPAKATLDSVGELFANADLDLDTMLAAGPDSLKAHLASFSADAEALDEAIAKNAELEVELADLREQNESLITQTSDLQAAVAEAGLELTEDQLASASEIKQALTTRAQDLAREHLAGAGHHALPETGPEGDPSQAAPSAAKILAEYHAMPPGKARSDFRRKHLETLHEAATAALHAAADSQPHQ
jgi:hypothetical protein